MPGLPVLRYFLEFAQVNVHLRINGFNSLKFIVITGKVGLFYTIFNIFGHVLFFSFLYSIGFIESFLFVCFLIALNLSFGMQDICCSMWDLWLCCTGSLVVAPEVAAYRFHCSAACGILVP